MTSDSHLLTTARDILEFDPARGGLISFRSRTCPDTELLAETQGIPLFIIQYLDENRRFREINSHQAAKITITTDRDGGDISAELLKIEFAGISGREIDVDVTVKTSPDDDFSHWSIRLENRTDTLVTAVRFPVIVLSYDLAGTTGSQELLWPYGPGKLYKAPKPENLRPDSVHTWELVPENKNHMHYPGYITAQFLAYYDDRMGVYLACRDSEGYIKRILPTHYEPGLCLGLSHIGDWPRGGERELEYDIVLRTFEGDWYSAAEIYRSWSLQQPWAVKTLKERDNVPDWLLDSPAHIIIRILGLLDAGSTEPVEEFLPYKKSIPLLEKISRDIEAPLVPVIMAWERPGPWIYPECFPPAGGEDSLREFTELARDRGWHIGTFCNGTRWVTRHDWSGYEGDEYYRMNGGDLSVCRTHEGLPWKEVWDITWRTSYPCCVGEPVTRKIAVDFVKTVAEIGLDWIQFFDQNVGCSSFPCFSENHEHPGAPGRWMTEKMLQLLEEFHAVAESVYRKSGGMRKPIYSVEGPVNEYLIQHFPICDIRVVPPDHTMGLSYFDDFVPLYHFLFHELVLMQGGFGSAPEPYHLPIRNAYNLVVGEIPGAVLKGDGKLLNKDTINWARWEPQVGINDDAVRMLKTALALRRGPGRDFLVYGRMMRPSEIEGIEVMRWQHGNRNHGISSVFHSAWQSPDGVFGVVLANWTEKSRPVTVRDERLGKDVWEHISDGEIRSRRAKVGLKGHPLKLPPLSCALVISVAATTLSPDRHPRRS